MKSVFSKIIQTENLYHLTRRVKDQKSKKLQEEIPWVFMLVFPNGKMDYEIFPNISFINDILQLEHKSTVCKKRQFGVVRSVNHRKAHLILSALIVCIKHNS